MTSENDSSYDIGNIEGILKIGNTGAPIADLSPNSDWKSYPPSSYSSNYGLPYQDHNYGAPPPPTPPPSPGSKAPVVKKTGKSFDVEALKSIKPNKAVPERKKKQPAKRQSSANRQQVTKTPSTPVKDVITRSETPKPVPVTPESEDDQNGDYVDSITRCICNFTHDDGFMICCDQCQVWQHIDCMGIDRGNIPEEYSCEQCMPRKVSKVRARMIQKNKLEELMRNNSTSEDENANAKRPSSLNLRTNKSKAQQKNNKKLTGGNNGTVITQMVKKKAVTLESTAPALRSRRQGKGNSTDTVLLSVDGDAEESSWTVPYEQATENQYSTDIQQSLNSYKSSQAYKLPSLLTELDRPRCQLKLLNNGKRGLEVDTVIPAEQALIEFKGKVMLQQQFLQENDFHKRPQPFVLFYDQWDGLEICVDASSFGNEARFVQRSCVPNAEVRHVIENGQIHLVLFSVKEISSCTEVTIPFDFDFKSCDYCVECACARSQCPVRKAARKLKRTHSPSGGTGDHGLEGKRNSAIITDSSKPSDATPVKRGTHEQLKVQIPDNSPESRQAVGPRSSNGKPTAENLKSPTTEAAHEETRRLSREEKKIEAYMKAFEKMEKREERRKEALQRITEKKESPTAQLESSQVDPPVAKVISPVAVPIVKTVSRPAPRRRRNKSGPAARRRTSSSTVSQPVSEAEQDDNSNSAAATASAAISAPASASCETSLDEIPAASNHIPAPAEVGSTHSGTLAAPSQPATVSSSNHGFRFPKTKKDLLNEWYHEKGLDRASTEKPLSVSTSMEDSIDFVKTNSSPGSSWAHLRRNSVSSNCHTTQITPTVPTRKLDTSMGSAKKRWLKQAMEEVDSSNQQSISALSSPVNNGQSPPPDANNITAAPITNVGMSAVPQTHSDTPVSPGSTPAPAPPIISSSSHTDFVTPLKKRRMARESLSQDSHHTSLDSHPTSPENSNPLVTPVNKSEPSAQQQQTFTAEPLALVKFKPPPEESANHAVTDMKPTPANFDNCNSFSPSKQSNTTPLSNPDKITATGEVPSGQREDWSPDAEGSDVPIPVTEQDEVVVPVTVSRFSPVRTVLSQLNDDVPTTVMDVDNGERASVLRSRPEMLTVIISPNTKPASTPEPSNSGLLSPGGSMMSPREPRTLSDMMKAAINDFKNTEAGATQLNNSASPPINSPESSPVKVGPSTPPPQNSSTSSEVSPSTPLRLNQIVPTGVREEDLMHSPSRLFTHSVSADFSEGNLSQHESLTGSAGASAGIYHQVWRSPSRPPDDKDRDVPNTPPQKKKVSLLEYRKRMKVLPSSGKLDLNNSMITGSVSFPCTPIPICEARKSTQITLPSLPLFNIAEEVKIIKPEMLKMPLSLDERLNIEFGLTPKPVKENGIEERIDVDCRSNTPPPPPPAIPPPTTVTNSRPAAAETNFNTVSAKSFSFSSDVTKPSENGVIDVPSERTGILAATNHIQVASPRPSSNGGSPNQTAKNNVKQKGPVPLKQGSLGAVMLGQSVSPIAASSHREFCGNRSISPMNLPKKYR